MIDVFGNSWPAEYELCPVCRQPDNCGDCNHEPYTDDEVSELGGTPSKCTCSPTKTYIDGTCPVHKKGGIQMFFQTDTFIPADNLPLVAIECADGVDTSMRALRCKAKQLPGLRMNLAEWLRQVDEMMLALNLTDLP